MKEAADDPRGGKTTAVTHEHSPRTPPRRHCRCAYRKCNKQCTWRGGVACSAAHLSDPGSYFASLSRPRWCAVGTVKNIRPPLHPHTDYCQHPCHPKLNKSVPRKSNGHHAHARLSARGENSSHWAKSGLLVFLFSDDTAAVYQQCMAKRKSAILIFDPQDYICSSSRLR